MDLSNVSVLNLLPQNIADDSNVKMMAEAFDNTLHDIINKIPDVAIIPNLMLDKIANETLVDLLAWQFHVDFYQPDFPLDIKIGLVKKSLDWHTRKGTPSTVEEIVTDIFAEAHLEEWYEYNGLPHHFRATVGDFLPDSATIAKITRAINSVKNTRSFMDIMTSIIVLHDELSMEENNTMVGTMHTPPDTLSQRVKRNGRVLRDGQTVFDTELTYLFHDGTVKRDVTVKRNGLRRVPATGAVFQPVMRSSGMQDIFHWGFGSNHVDNWQSQVYRNGAIRRDSTVKRNGFIESLNDSLNLGKMNLYFTDEMEISELQITISRNDAAETINRHIPMDGSHTRNEKLLRSSHGMVDPFALTNFTDAIKATDDIEVAEDLTSGMRYHYFRDGNRKRNGTIQRKSMILIPLE
jgi:phage tail P2-like protein